MNGIIYLIVAYTLMPFLICWAEGGAPKDGELALLVWIFSPFTFVLALILIPFELITYMWGRR